MKTESPVTERSRIIFLVGFMGAGKTTVGRALAEKLSCRFTDLDEMIESRAGMAVRDIFEKLGESEFRRVESDLIASLGNNESAVVALGGGAFAFENNRKIVRELGVSIWLECPLEICLERTGRDEKRPLLGSHGEMSTLLESRRGSYEESDYRVDSGSRAPGEIADEIIDLLDSLCPASRLDQHRFKGR